MTAAEILGLLPAFEAATARRAATAVAGRLAAGLSLERAAHAALDERDALLLREEVGPGDPEAAAERVFRDARRLEAQAVIALLAADARARAAGTLPEALVALAVRLASEPRSRLAAAALSALAGHAAAGRAIPRAALDRAEVLAGDPSAPVWSQAAAIELVGAGLGERAALLLARRLEPASAPDDLFVRCAAARWLARVAPAQARLALPRMLADPSEHVRMELAALLGALEIEGALELLVNPARESSPRVRASAAIALGALSEETLAAVLAGDPDELPRRIALEEAEPRAARNANLRLAIERAVHADPSALLRRLAAEAAERLHHRLDVEAGRILGAVRSALAGLPEGGEQALPLMPAPDEAALGRALAVVATDDLGLDARAGRGGWRITRGDRLRRRLWRIWHEARNPAAAKRPGHLHTVGRILRGALRAPPGRLAEVTPTGVPGERVLVPRLDDWGRALPTVDDLAIRPRGGTLSLFTAWGQTTVEFPGGRAWLSARTAITARYAALSALRLAALSAPESRDRHRFVEAVEALGFQVRFLAHRRGPVEILELFAAPAVARPGPLPRAAEAGPAAMTALLPLSLHDLVTPPASNLSHLAAFGVGALGLMAARLHQVRRDIERERASIPLSIGGWGTRGKSGTERLKAALFQGLGCEVLVKTTGCEATFIHAIPEAPAHEIFIYRTYDKATIWEQRELLRVASRLEVDFFSWECMALDPGYVDILSHHWMRGELATLTNAYPDHEDVHGPAGADVPRVMARFIPRGGTVFTAEEQMLPLLREGAAERGATVVAVAWRDHALLPADLLDRFPYHEHPHNIALVCALAARLGVTRERALMEMADWVIPDLGVLKTYPEARWRGRRLEFSNGMSANERVGFLNNWSRLGFEKAGRAPGEWVVTVVNNRADRPARSRVFADIVAEDVAAHAQVLIGSDVRGLQRRIERCLRRVARAHPLFHADERALPPAERERRALERADRLLGRVKLASPGRDRLLAEAAAMARGLGVAEAPLMAGAIAHALDKGQPDLDESRRAIEETLRGGLGGWAAALGEHGEDAVRHLVRLTVRHAAVLSWKRAVSTACAAGTSTAGVARDFERLWCALFAETLVPLTDPGATGDQIVDALARACPPGFRVRVMGLQNIKGAGLDFAYRWLTWERTTRALSALEVAEGAEAVRLAEALAAAEDLGILDLTASCEAVSSAAARAADPAPLERLGGELGRRRDERLGELSAAGDVQRSTARVLIDETLDVWDGIRRRRRADRLLADLIAGRISHRRAADESRELIRREKAGHGRREK